MSELNDIKIAGSGKIPSGKYNKVEIAGSGSSQGDLECEVLECSGAATLNGNVISKEIEVNGATSVHGNVASKNVEINGTCSIHGSLAGEYIEINGTSKIDGDVISIRKIESNGAFKVTQKIKAETIESSGVIKAASIEAEKFIVDGGIEANSINVESFLMTIMKGKFNKISHNRKIGEIVGNEITIKESNKKSINLKLFGFEFNFGDSGSNLYEIDTIEGDKIFLENVHCKNVRGKNITISKNCKIENIEYTETLDILEEGIVTNSNRI